MFIIIKTVIVLAFLLIACAVNGQKIITDSLIPYRISHKIQKGLSKKSAEAELRLNVHLKKSLKRFQKLEHKLAKKAAHRNPQNEASIFSGTDSMYSFLISRDCDVHTKNYNGHLDSLKTALNFLHSRPNSLTDSGCISKLIGQYNELQSSFEYSEQVKTFIEKRKKVLSEQLPKLGLSKYLKSFQKECYYLKSGISEVKEAFQNPSKIETKLLDLVKETNEFKEFFKKNSQLSSLFPLNGVAGNSPSAASLTGLQSRISMSQNLQARFGNTTSVRNQLIDNIQSAQSQLQQIKNEALKFGTGSIDNGVADMPKNFKPNSQKTKSFLKRLEFGTNIQSQKMNSFFPATSDLGLSIGYKLHDNSSVGIGASTKIGFTGQLKNLKVSYQGLGIRSYIDYKLKGGIYITGGYESNYKSLINSISQLQRYSAWQKSGLVGLSKKYNVSKKLKGNVQLLWDFLSYSQTPCSQALIFRLGYSIK